VPLCFGSRKRFKQQFNLTEHGYVNHEAWKTEWQRVRFSEFFTLGSKDETGGNQSCTASLASDGSLTLRLRLPDALKEHGKYIILSNIHFSYGHAEIVAAVQSCSQRNKLRLAKEDSYQHHGQAIHFRFKKDRIGWRVFVTTDTKHPPTSTQQSRGVFGVDINSDHLAIVETDRFGNPLQTYTVPLHLTGKSTVQARALIGDAVAQIVTLCEKSQKPLVIEDLKFQEKKTHLREQRSSYARMLSSFAYRTILTHFAARSARSGVQVYWVNPAYTSLIGRVKFAKRYGLSIHHAAALCIGRRFLGVSERAPPAVGIIPDGKGSHVTLDLPARNRSRHVWSHWAAINRKLRVALTAHFRAARADPRTPARQFL
jgi:IS605 OrfB family transposase